MVRKMSRKIEISNELFKRLEQLAVGFDTPETVIVRLLDSLEGVSSKKPLLTFSPENESDFKKELIKSKEAEVVIYKNDNIREITRWKAHRFTETSNLRGNLWSGMLRDWKSKGITKVDISILPVSLNIPDDETEQIKRLALEFGLTFDEMSTLFYEVDTNESDDGMIYNYIVQFNDDCDKEILSKIDGLHDHLWINVDCSVLD